jgi:hypothetical protein
MELSGVSVFGVFLFLGFVMPGFCYLFIFTLLFTDTFKKVREWFQSSRIEQALTLVLPGLGIVGGLLLSSCSFALELILRCLIPSVWECLFPDMDLARIAMMEASGETSFYVYMMAGSAIMHLNIALGVIIMIGPYLYYETVRPRSFLLIGILVVANLIVACELFHRGKDALDVVVEVVETASAAPKGDSAKGGEAP